DAGGVLAGFTGVLVRDGYAGYDHLTTAVHAECGAHLLRTLKGVHDADPNRQRWAEAMTNTLLMAKDMMAWAAQAGARVLEPSRSASSAAPTPVPCRSGRRKTPPTPDRRPRKWSTASPATTTTSCGSPPTPRSGSPTTKANVIFDQRNSNRRSARLGGP